MQVRYEIRQLVSSVNRRWLEKVGESPSERVMETEFQRLHAEHPDQYFELVHVGQVEHCLLHVLQHDNAPSEIVVAKESTAAACACRDPNCLSTNPQVSAAMDATSNPSLTRRQVWEILEAARQARNSQGTLFQRVSSLLSEAKLPTECAGALVEVVNDLLRGPALVDSAVARHFAEEVHGKRYGIDWVYHDDERGVLSEREIE